MLIFGFIICLASALDEPKVKKQDYRFEKAHEAIIYDVYREARRIRNPLSEPVKLYLINSVLKKIR
jgi:hypothetical protein